MTCPDIVDPIWTLCELLREDGVKDKDSITELAQLLVVKLAHVGGEAGVWGGCRQKTGGEWLILQSHEGEEQLQAWRAALQRLGRDADPLLAAAFAAAQTRIQSPACLQQLVTRLDALDWAALPKAPSKSKAKTKAKPAAGASAQPANAPAHAQALADVFDGLLARAAQAGHIAHTPLALADALARCLAPQVGDAVQDPAAGTGALLLAAHRAAAAKAAAGDAAVISISGLEVLPATRRLALMNCWLHGLGTGDSADAADPAAADKGSADAGPVRLGNPLGEAGAALPIAQRVVCHAPTGTASGTLRSDLPQPTRSRPLALLQHAMLKLAPGGRAAVVLPDELLRSGGTAAELRRELLDRCQLHTVLRLPLDLLDVPSSVLFFDQPADAAAGGTQALWVYDMRRQPGGAQGDSPFAASAASASSAAASATPVFGLLPGRAPKSAKAGLGGLGGLGLGGAGGSGLGGAGGVGAADAAPAKPTQPDPALFDAFIAAYGDDPAKRAASAESPVWRRFTRDWLRDQHGDRLDIAWLAAEAVDLSLGDEAAPPEGPGERAQLAMDELKAAFAALDAVMGN